MARLEKELAGIEAASRKILKDWKFHSFEKGWHGLKVHLDFESNEKNKLKNLADPKAMGSTNANNKIVPGKVGNALKLTGDDAVNLTKGTANFSRDQPFSFALWINTPRAHERAVIVRRSKAWTDAASRGYELLLENGKLSAALIHFWPGNAIRVVTKKPVPVKSWQHVAITYDGSSRAKGLQIYLNGELAETEVTRDNLTREIVGGGDDFIGLGQRMRDKGFKNGSVDEFYVFDREITELEIKRLFDPSFEPSDDQKFAYYLSVFHYSSNSARKKLQVARKKKNDIEKGIKEIMVMKDMPSPRKVYVLNRGMYNDRADEVVAATPESLSSPKKKENLNRLDLAEWLTAPNHPLTARVTVNRYWQMMFGRGLVSTSEDFGSQGRPPSHRKLLDWLARDFIDHDWDLHHLLKQIALSSTYRQSANVSPHARERDPENIWLARGPSYKLPAEMIRDNALAVSGLISKKVGGPSAKPYDLAVSFKPIKPDKGENLYRRSVYTYWKRTGPSPMMMTLDSSKKEVCRVKREETASPLQSLVLLNSPQFIEAARVTAEKLIGKHAENDDSLIEEAFRLFTSRKPDPREVSILKNLIREQAAAFSADPGKAKTYFKTGDKSPAAKANEARLASVTVLVSTLMNFDESITKR